MLLIEESIEDISTKGGDDRDGWVAGIWIYLTNGGNRKLCLG